MPDGVLPEAYARLHRYGPEWGEDQLTNHGPMAVEVLVRRGYAAQVDRWVDDYRQRLDELPTELTRITGQNWPEALGDGRRIGDWTRYFAEELRAAPWRDVLVTWWPRLLPGVLAGTTHGVIRVGHTVRAMLAGADDEATLDELAHGLAFWAARFQRLPSASGPAGRLDPDAALTALNRIPVQQGRVAERMGRLATTPGWDAAVAALRPPAGPDDARAQLSDLVTAAAAGYLEYGHASPVLLVHTATAPNAVLHTLPALPREMWAPSVATLWTTTAAIVAAYAPPAGTPGPATPDLPDQADPVAEAVDRAVAHGDEHVIKFTDTAAEVYARTGERRALAAAHHITGLIRR